MWLIVSQLILKSHLEELRPEDEGGGREEEEGKDEGREQERMILKQLIIKYNDSVCFIVLNEFFLIIL